MKMAINIIFVIIVILLLSTLVVEKPAGAVSSTETEQLRLQAIVDDTDGVDAIIRKLRAESETGRLLADYIASAQKFLDTEEFDLSKDTPDDIIPNYLALKTITLFPLGSMKITKKYLVKLNQLNSKNSWFDEDNFFVNGIEFTIRTHEERGIWRDAGIVKNLRYVSVYSDDLRKSYFRWLKKSKGWVRKRELAFWQIKLGHDVCAGVKYSGDCISKLETEFKTLPPIKPTYGNLLCNVIIHRSGETIKIKWCEQKFSQINPYVKTVS